MTGLDSRGQRSSFQISWRSVNLLLSYRDLMVLNMRRSSAILDFYKFEILTAANVNRINTYHRTKFRGDKSKRC